MAPLRTLPKKLRPEPPQNLRATSFTDKSMTLEWDAIEGANLYWLYINESRPVAYFENKATIDGLAPATAYSFNVSASSRGNEGAKSEVFTKKTKVSAPVLQPFKLGDPYLLGIGMSGNDIIGCRLYNADGTRYITTGTMTNGDLKIYLNNNVNIVAGGQYMVKIVDGNPNSVPLLSDAEGMPASFTVLPKV